MLKNIIFSDDIIYWKDVIYWENIIYWKSDILGIWYIERYDIFEK